MNIPIETTIKHQLQIEEAVSLGDRLGVTQTVLGELLGVSRGSVNRWYRRRVMPDTYYVIQLNEIHEVMKALETAGKLPVPRSQERDAIIVRMLREALSERVE